MSRLDVAADALAELARVSLRRARHGPLHESWSFRYEVANAFLKRTMVRTARLDWPAQRRAWDALRVASPVFRRFRFEPARLGAARGEWFVPEGVGPDAPVLLYLHGGCFAFGSN